MFVNCKSMRKKSHRHFSILLQNMWDSVSAKPLNFSRLVSSKAAGCTTDNDSFLHSHDWYSYQIWSIWKSAINVRFFENVVMLSSIRVPNFCKRW